MPYRTFNVNEVARYLHLRSADVERLLKNRAIPFERHGEKLLFRKLEIDAWASQRILGMEKGRLHEYHEKTTQGAREITPAAAALPALIEPGYIDAKLPAKTRASVVREMAVLAEKTGHVSDPAHLAEALRAREELCSTGLPGGLAVLHTRHHEEHLFDAPFIVLGRTVQQIPFGAPDGRPTDLFFLLASLNERLHLHLLARICLMAQKTELLEQLRQAADAPAMYDCVIAAEEAVL